MRIFFHIAAMNSSWYKIYREIYDEIVQSGLLESCTKVTVGFLGSPGDFNIVAEELVGEKFEVYYFGNDFNQFEFPTLGLLDSYCKNDGEEYVMYCHTKGVSNPDHLCKRYWRKAMIKATITDWKRCNELLEQNDLVGYNLHRPKTKNSAPIHFSGNWWWANPKYIKECSSILLLQKTPKFISHWLSSSIRFQCEFWLRTGPWLKAKWRSTGVENANREVNIDPIIELDVENVDPFELAGLSVEKRFVVNMVGQSDRLESALIEISKAKIKNVTVFDAMVLEKPDDCLLATNGQLGCYSSNLACIESAYESDCTNLLILEDDVEFVHNFGPLFADCYKDVPKDWDVLFIGGYEKNRGPYKNIKGKVWKTGDHWGTHCYLLSKSGIKKMHEYLSNNPIEWEIDMLMVHHMPDLIKYSIHPTLAYQKPFTSNTRPLKSTSNGSSSTN